jgi:hypothetical protein
MAWPILQDYWRVCLSRRGKARVFILSFFGSMLPHFSVIIVSMTGVVAADPATLPRKATRE